MGDEFSTKSFGLIQTQRPLETTNVSFECHPFVMIAQKHWWINSFPKHSHDGRQSFSSFPLTTMTSMLANYGEDVFVNLKNDNRWVRAINALTELIQVPDFTLDENRAIHAIFPWQVIFRAGSPARSVIYFSFLCVCFGISECAMSRETRTPFRIQLPDKICAEICSKPSDLHAVNHRRTRQNQWKAFSARCETTKVHQR